MGVVEKAFVNTKDTRLGMFLLGTDKDKPVLLIVGGGPGISEYLLETEYPTGLDEDFVVCYMEHRGISLSFNPKLDKRTLTTKQYIEDVLVITKYLKKRFHQKKIYVMGHSFGTYLALQVVAMHPEHYHAYIAMSQMCDQRSSEFLAYDYMVEQYKKRGNQKRVKEFEECNIRESEEVFQTYCTSMLRDKSMHELGIGTTRTMKSVIKDIVLASFRNQAYTRRERLNIWRGKLFVNQAKVAKEAWAFNAFEKIKRVEIPVYFFGGKYDYTCCYSLQKKYYEQLMAPVKKFYTFEQSAHSPVFEEPEKARRILREEVLTREG